MLFIMPLFSSNDIHEYVLSRKFIHMGIIMSNIISPLYFDALLESM